MILFIGLSYVFSGSLQTGAQTEYSIQVSGHTWNHSTLTISIIPQENETWWEPLYLNAVLHGIAQWKDAIEKFSLDYSNFSYLSDVQLVPTISSQVVPGFDVYVEWNCVCDREDLIGQSQATIQSSCIIIKNMVSLTAKAPSGHVMNEVDMQNIVVHEIGHTLGLSHTKNSEDVMYAIVEYRDTVKPISSLDTYAVSQVFKWMKNSTNICSKESVLVLPPDINYIHYKINAENLPVANPQNTLELLLREEILALVAITVTLIIALTIVLKKRNKPQ